MDMHTEVKCQDNLKVVFKLLRLKWKQYKDYNSLVSLKAIHTYLTLKFHSNKISLCKLIRQQILKLHRHLFFHLYNLLHIEHHLAMFQPPYHAICLRTNLRYRLLRLHVCMYLNHVLYHLTNYLHKHLHLHAPELLNHLLNHFPTCHHSVSHQAKLISLNHASYHLNVSHYIQIRLAM